MGCHTWFWKLREDIDILDAQNKAIENFAEENRDLPEHLYKEYEKCFGDYNFIEFWWTGEHTLVDKMGVYQTVDLHDVFRTTGKYKYTRKRLYSITETLHFCEAADIQLNPKQKSSLNTFWNQNPNGIISFG